MNSSSRLSLKRTLIAAQRPLSALRQASSSRPHAHTRPGRALSMMMATPNTLAVSDSSSSSSRRSPPSVAAVVSSDGVRRWFHAGAVPRLADAAAAAASEPTASNDNDSSNNNEPPPIKWTTDRLTPEQVAKVDAIFHKILWLDLMETSILMECINQKLGLKLSPKQRAAIQRQLEQQGGGGVSGPGAAEEKVEEDAGPKLVDVKLTGFDAKAKIKVIKEVRSLAGLGLKEAKELVEGAPTTILKELKPELAEEIKIKLEGLGATVEIA